MCKGLPWIVAKNLNGMGLCQRFRFSKREALRMERF